MITSSSKWWDINKILSYNKLLNFVVGLHGGGKTYGSKKRLFKTLYANTSNLFTFADISRKCVRQKRIHDGAIRGSCKS